MGICCVYYTVKKEIWKGCGNGRKKTVRKRWDFQTGWKMEFLLRAMRPCQLVRANIAQFFYALRRKG